MQIHLCYFKLTRGSFFSISTSFYMKWPGESRTKWGLHVIAALCSVRATLADFYRECVIITITCYWSDNLPIYCYRTQIYLSSSKPSHPQKLDEDIDDSDNISSALADIQGNLKASLKTIESSLPIVKESKIFLVHPLWKKWKQECLKKWILN